MTHDGTYNLDLAFLPVRSRIVSVTNKLIRTSFCFKIVGRTYRSFECVWLYYPNISVAVSLIDQKKPFQFRSSQLYIHNMFWKPFLQTGYGIFCFLPAPPLSMIRFKKSGNVRRSLPGRLT